MYGSALPGSSETGKALEEIRERVAALRAASAGERIVPPLLLLGVMERVGSNWMSDTLRPITDQHNEPFRQQISPDHPLSAMNPHAPDRSCARLGNFGRHWLVTFAVSKYSPAVKAVKETNLFFALPTLLAIFPESPIAVLTRSPLGVASSFARSDLFRRWDYRSRYEQIAQAARQDRHRIWSALVPRDDPAEPVALARLQTLNTVLLATELHQRPGGNQPTVIPYETAVLDPAAAHARLAPVLPELPEPGHGAMTRSTPAADDTFVTTDPKTTLTAYLHPAGAATIRETVSESLAAAHNLVPAEMLAQAREWLGGDQLYTLSPARPAPLHRTGGRNAPRRCPAVPRHSA